MREPLAVPPQMAEKLLDLPLWAAGLGFVAWAVLVVFATPLLFRIARRLTGRTKTDVDDMILVAARGPVRAILLLLGVGIVLEAAGMPERYARYGRATVFSLIVATFIVFADRLARTLLSLYMPRADAVKTGSSIIIGLVRALIIATGILVLLGSLGISITPILASLGVGSLAVALAMQDTLGQFFAGVYVTVDQPVRLGDYIRLEGGEEGFVEKIGWRSTRLLMPQNNLIVIPNSKLASSTITNFSLPGPELMLSVTLSVGYGSDLKRVADVATDVARDVLSSVPGGVPSFEPIVRFRDFDANGISLQVILRVAKFTDQMLVRHEFLQRLHNRFRKEGIVVPYPVRELRLGPEEREFAGRIIPPAREGTAGGGGAANPGAGASGGEAPDGGRGATGHDDV